MVGDSIDDYVPRAVDPSTWRSIGPQARAWTSMLGVDLGAQAVQRLKPLAQYLAWRHNGGLSTVDAEAVFRADDIEWFVRNACDHLAPGTRSTYRSALRTIGEAVVGFEVACPSRTLPMAKPSPLTAYSDSEFAALLGAIRGRPTVYQRHNAMSLVVFARGAGLTSADLAALVGTDIERTGQGTVVIHLGGPLARRSVVLASWESEALRIAALVGDRPVFRSGRERITRNDIGRFCERLSWNDAPGLSVTRLRITWILEHLVAGTHLSALAEAAGVSATSIARYADLAPKLSNTVADKVLRTPGTPP